MLFTDFQRTYSKCPHRPFQDCPTATKIWNLSFGKTLLFCHRKTDMAAKHSEPQLQAWNISEDGFPEKGSLVEKLQFMLGYAILAPSSHNTQPWIFKIVGNAVELYADRTRALPVVDPDDRALAISCGAALFHLQLAMHHFGYEYRTELLPDPLDRDLLARVTVSGKTEQKEDALFYAITKRRTNRLPFEEREVSGKLLSSLMAIAQKHHAWLDVVQGDSKNAVADLISEGDRTQMSDKRFRRELASWIHPNRSQSRDGMPGYAHGITGDIASYIGPFLVRTFDIGRGQAAKDRQLAAGSPVLAVLGTDADRPVDWINAGQAIAEILLRARTEDVWASFMNQPIEVPDLRPRLRDALGRKSGLPQLLVRMGYGSEIKPTPRRQVGDVLAD